MGFSLTPSISSTLLKEETRAAFTRFLCFQGSCVSGHQLGAQWGEPKFRQLEEILPTPNAYRTASGAPGESYWQQKADYDIKVELDDELQRIVGSEVIHYQNNSPDDLDYLWIQIDANLFAKDSDGHLTELAPDLEGLKFRSLRALLERESFEGHATIHSVKDATGQTLEHQVIKTMMRIALPTPLRAGESMRFPIAWSYNIIDAQLIRARSGYEFSLRMEISSRNGSMVSPYGSLHRRSRLASQTVPGEW